MALLDQPQNTPTIQVPVQSNVQWGGLSKHKIASITLCDRDGAPLKDQTTGNLIESPVVEAILTDGEFSVESQYASPFENSSPETRMPTLLAMLQSGEALEAVSNVVGSSSTAGKLLNGTLNVIDLTLQSAGLPGVKGTLSALEGKTNLTKVNSTQVFVSTTSIRMPLTLFFMALKDAKKEVERQIMQLEQWVVPIDLYDKTLAVSIADKGILGGLFPSLVPPMISLTYGGKTYKPFVIESVSSPIVVPMDADGNRLSVSVTMTILSRQAWDAKNIRNLYGV